MRPPSTGRSSTRTRFLVDELIAGVEVALEAGDFALAGDPRRRRSAGGDRRGRLDLRRNDRLWSSGSRASCRSRGTEARTGTAPPFEFWASQTTTFSDIGGLDDVKKTVNRTILPFRRPDLYERSPAPGALAAASSSTAHRDAGRRCWRGRPRRECALPFANVRIEEIVDPHYGVSEQNLHAVFEQARGGRRRAVLFLDEIDATVGFARRKHAGSAGRQLVDQLLQELEL